MRNAISGAISAAIILLVAVSQAALATTSSAATAIPRIRPDHIGSAVQVLTISPRLRATIQYYTVRAGDTLSGIAGKMFGNPSRWPWLYEANRKAVGENPNFIVPGLRLEKALGNRPDYGRVVESVSRARQVVHDYRTAAAGGKVWGVTRGYPNDCGDGDGDGYDVACQGGQPAAQPQYHAANQTSSGGYPGGAFGACVVARESGGNSQVMNSSGHYGLYQFSASTWAAYGGNPADFGHASVAEQERVFSNALAQGGESNWSPYDGC